MIWYQLIWGRDIVVDEFVQSTSEDWICTQAMEHVDLITLSKRSHSRRKILSPILVALRWIVDCGLWIVDCGLWIVDCGLVRCGLWISTM